jgi:hypothetical protein
MIAVSASASAVDDNGDGGYNEKDMCRVNILLLLARVNGVIEE